MAKRGRRSNAEKAQSGASPGPDHNGLDDDNMQALFLQHMRSYKGALEAKKAADARFKNACKLAKAEVGKHAVSDIKKAIELESPEGEAALKSEIERHLRVARWMGASIGTQGNLFEEDRMPAAERAYGEGKRAGMQGESARPPHDPSTEQYREWMRGHGDGTEIVVRQGIKPLDDRPQGSQPADAGEFGEEIDPDFSEVAGAEASPGGDDVPQGEVDEAGQPLSREAWKAKMRAGIADGDQHIRQVSGEIDTQRSQIGTAQSTAVITG